ncbi:MAG: dihydropteroate synthase [Nibricoccus sp.]
MSQTSAENSRQSAANGESRRFVCRDRAIALNGRPKMVGIVNITEDSFFDGGKFSSTDAAVAHGLKLVRDGAAVLDVGGQSTRPGFVEISPAEEIARVVPVVERLVAKSAVPVSIDTYKPDVARAALKAGAHILNDIHGFQGADMLADIAAEFDAGVVLMHNDPTLKQSSVDPMAAVLAFFEKSLAIAQQHGVQREKIILDPGIGFGKTQEQNLALMARLGELRGLGLPILLGASRKSVIGNVLGLPVEERLEGTLATTALAVWQRVEFIRVHDVLPNLRAANVAAALRPFSKS